MEENAKKPGAEELAKIEFDFFKHLTTLSAAAAVAVLAVYREVAFDQVSLIITLLCFAGSIGLALGGMLNVTSRLRQWTWGDAEYHSPEYLARITTLVFGTGITSLVFNTLLDLLPRWLQGVIVGGIFFLFIAFWIIARLMVRYYARKARKSLERSKGLLNETREALEGLRQYLDELEEAEDGSSEELHEVQAKLNRLQSIVEERQEELNKMASTLEGEPQKKSWWQKVFGKKATRGSHSEE